MHVWVRRTPVLQQTTHTISIANTFSSSSESVHSPRRRDKSCVPADKVTLYALGVTAEMAINTLREECYRRLDHVHALMCAVDTYVCCDDSGTVGADCDFDLDPLRRI